MLTPREIAAVAAAEFGLEPEILWDRRKPSRSASRARSLAWWLARRLTPWSWPEIGERVFDVDHSTALAGARRTDDDPALLERAEALLAALRDDAEPAADRLAALARDIDALRRDVAALRSDVAAFREELAAERARIDRMHLAPVSARNDDRDAAMIASWRRAKAAQNRARRAGRA